jgi:HEAT repeat protein
MQWWMLRQLKARNPRSRISALQKVAEDGALELIEPVGQCLSDDDAAVRIAAAEALGRIKREEAAAPLNSRFSREPEPEVRRAIVKALHALHTFGGPNIISTLASALTDPSGDVGWHAAKALQSMRWEPGNESECAAWHLAVSQFDEAIAFGAAAIEPLAKLTRGLAFQRSIRAVEALAKIGGAKAVKPLLDAMTSQDFTVRSAAATALGEVGDARGVDPLVRALRDPHHQVCLSACISLSKLGDQSAVDPLITVTKHSAPDVRAAAAAALGKLLDRRAAMPLVALLQDPDCDVREAAAAGLGSLGDERAIEHLIIALTDSNGTVRQTAAAALRRVEPYWERSEAAMRAIPRLQACLKHTEYWMRHSAAAALKKLGVSQDETKPISSEAAVKKRHAAHTILCAMLSDSDRAFRHAGTEALGRIGLPDSLPRLVERLTDSDHGVRRAAALSLEALRWQPASPIEKARQLIALEHWQEVVAIGPGAIDPLIEAVSSGNANSRRRGIETLVKMGGPKVIRALKALAADPDPTLCGEASAALRALGSNEAPPPTGKNDAWSEVTAFS